VLTAPKNVEKKVRGKERNLTCSFVERLLGHCATNPLALHALALHHACLVDEDAKERNLSGLAKACSPRRPFELLPSSQLELFSTSHQIS